MKLYRHIGAMGFVLQHYTPSFLQGGRAAGRLCRAPSFTCGHVARRIHSHDEGRLSLANLFNDYSNWP